MTLQRNHYEVLGVPRTATTDEIKTKYRELARKFHPDIAQDKVMGQKIFSQINQAYRVLGDPDRRAEYDAAMAAEAFAPTRNGTATPASNGSGVSAAPAPNGQTSANVTRLLAEAETAMLQGNVGKVKSICEMVLKTDPGSQKALGLLGDALVQMGRPQEAAAAYQQALKVAPNVVLQAKLSRLTGSVPNGNGAHNGTAPAPTGGLPPRTPPATNGTGAHRTDQGRARTDLGHAEKPSGGLLSRLLGKK